MPLYPYHCRSCGEMTEIFARTPREDLGPKLSCSHCGSRELERRLSPPRLPADESAVLEMLRRRREAQGMGRSPHDD
ncbi:MAG: hypothetical protein OXC94_09080 [Chloroflexi bacterium]|nr:hypothetical protein [Chloroflexota bacterium]